jgi:methionyl-tRNA synthetase
MNVSVGVRRPRPALDFTKIYMSKNFYVTSPIYYVNDAPHIGHAYTSIACDAIARFKRLQNNEVFFLTGTDEHGQKVEKSALSRSKKPQEFCDEVSSKFRELAQTIGLSNDDFIRTTEERHKKSAQEFWKILEKKWLHLQRHLRRLVRRARRGVLC